MADESKAESSGGFKGYLATAGAVVAVLAGLVTLVKYWEELFPPAPKPQGGITVMVSPSKVAIPPNGTKVVTWTLAETGNVGVNIVSRTGEWRTSKDRLIKTIGPIENEMATRTLWPPGMDQRDRPVRGRHQRRRR